MPGLGHSTDIAPSGIQYSRKPCECLDLDIQLGTQIPSIQGLMLPTFTYVTEIWGGDLKSSHWKVLEKVMKMHMVSHVEVHSSKTFHILLVEFGGCPIELHALKLTIGSRLQLAVG
jgi:hypothetical protein